jgi:hypothetical protein
MNLAQMDLFTSEYTYSEILNYNPTVGMEEYGTRLPAVGYDTTSMIYNMGDTGIVQFWPLIMLLKLFLFTQIAKYRMNYVNKVKTLTVSLFYNWPLRFFLEFYLELSIASIIKFEAKTYDLTTFCNFFDTVLGFFWLALILAAPPAFMIYFWCKQDRLRYSESYYKKFETVFEATRIDTFMQINY